MYKVGAAFRGTTAARFIFRGNITSKRGNKNFYKGRGAPSMGYFAKHGKYIIDRQKYARQTFSVPNLNNFKLKPYVALHAKKRQVPRPQIIVDVDLKQRVVTERALRITRMNELKPLLSKSSKETLSKAKVHRYKREYQRIIRDMVVFKDELRKNHERCVDRKKLNVAKQQRKTIKKEKDAAYQTKLYSQIQEYQAAVANGTKTPYVSHHVRKLATSKQKLRSYEMMRLFRAKKNQHVHTIKKTKQQQEQQQTNV